MDNQKQQIVDSLKQANNVLVTVSNNPSVDQLAACIGLTLALNKMKKHATAVFSGAVPPIIEFLQPEKTIEKTTDSLRDFIIAIDKAKADKLRYKVEDKFVKIFITPYRTSIGEKDLEFSEGDFNVDVVLALGVHKQTDLDQAITAHGRILHDATVISINNQPNIELGSINLLEPQASSLSEMAVELLDLLDKTMIDNQIATTLLTGIVAETDRFRNAKTTPTTMSISAELLAAGANQQLVASKLESPPPAPQPIAQVSTAAAQEASGGDKPDDGTLKISHEDEVHTQPSVANNGAQNGSKAPQIHIDENGQFHPLEERKDAGPAPTAPGMGMPPTQPMASPLNPFAQPPNNQQPVGPNSFSPALTPAAGGLGLPPLMPPYGAPPMGPSVPTAGPAPTAPGMGMPPTQPMASPLNPFAQPPNNQQPAQPSPPVPQQQPIEPSVVSPSIIQPDPNAVHAQHDEDEGPALPPLPPKDIPPTIHTEGPHLMMQPPTFGSQLNAGMMPEEEDEEAPSGTPMSLPALDHSNGLLDREPLQSQSPQAPPAPQGSVGVPSIGLPPPPPPKVGPSPATSPVLGGDQVEPPLLAEESLSSLERDVNSPHMDYIESPVPNLPSSSPAPLLTSTPPLDQSSVITPPPVDDTSSQSTPTYDQAADVAEARDAINAAFQNDGDTSDASPLTPVASLNAQPLGSPLHEEESSDALPPGLSSDPHGGMPAPPPVPPPLIPPTPS